MLFIHSNPSSVQTKKKSYYASAIRKNAGTIERAAELKVAQKAVIYAMALDEPGSRTPSRTLELEWMATDSSKDHLEGFWRLL